MRTLFLPRLGSVAGGFEVGLGFQGLGFRVQGLGFRVWALKVYLGLCWFVLCFFGGESEAGARLGILTPEP